MIILAIRTDKPEAEIYLYDDNVKLAEIKWQAHRELGQIIHKKIQELLKTQTTVQGQSLYSIGKVGFYEGPGSFTGLRIGASVANALAYGLNVPIVAGTGDNWIEDCLTADVTKFKPVSVVYGSDPNITQQKK